MKNILHLLPDRKEFCILIRGAFSQSFCDELISVRKHAFRKANTHYPTHYRNNERQVLDDAEFTTFLFDQIRHFIPEQVDINGVSHVERGQWKLLGLNPKIRLCRYSPGQYFNKHLDGVHYESSSEQSKLTFMIYLNGQEDFEGGNTLFYADEAGDQVIAKYSPQKGDLMIFDHTLWHAGSRVEKGEKYILRSDLMYERIGAMQLKTGSSDLFCNEGHLGYIWTVAKLRTCLLTGGRDKKIKIWTVEGEKLFEIFAHQQSILALEAVGSKYVVSGSRDQFIKIWKWEDQNLILVNAMKEHTGAVLCLCRIDDGQFLSGGADGCVNQITLKGELIATHVAHEEWIWSISMLDRHCYLTVSEDGTLKAWQLTDHQLIAMWSADCPITALNANDGQIFLGMLNGRICHLVLDLTTRKFNLIRCIPAHIGKVTTIKTVANALHSGGEDKAVKSWEKDLTLLQEHYHLNYVQDLAIIDNHLISVSYDGEIRKHELPKHN